MSYRTKELDPDHLKYIGLVFRWAKTQYKIQRADAELMFYLYPLRFFTRIDFQDGTLHYHWDKNRFLRLQRDGWIKQIDNYVANKRLGEHFKYTLTKKSEIMIRRLCRILDGQEEFPLSVRNKLTGSDRYSHKVLLTSIKNKKKNGSNTNSAGS